MYINDNPVETIISLKKEKSWNNPTSFIGPTKSKIGEGEICVGFRRDENTKCWEKVVMKKGESENLVTMLEQSGCQPV